MEVREIKYAEKIDGILDKKNINKICPICNGNLEAVEALYMLTMVDPIKNTKTNEGLLIVPLLCKNCRHVALFDNSIFEEV